PPASTAANASTTTTLPAAGDPGSLILSTVPSGYVKQADDFADTGPTTLEKATLDDPSDGAGALLHEAGFQRGYQRTWSASDGLDSDTILLYQFATPEGAQRWANHWLDEVHIGAKGEKISDFDVPLGSAHGFGVRGDYADSS